MNFFSYIKIWEIFGRAVFVKGVTISTRGLAECEAQRADARRPKGRVRGRFLGMGQQAPSPPARGSGGTL